MLLTDEMNEFYWSLYELIDNWKVKIDENKMNRTQLTDENDAFDGQVGQVDGRLDGRDRGDDGRVSE